MAWLSHAIVYEDGSMRHVADVCSDGPNGSHSYWSVTCQGMHDEVVRLEEGDRVAEAFLDEYLGFTSPLLDLMYAADQGWYDAHPDHVGVRPDVEEFWMGF